MRTHGIRRALALAVVAALGLTALAGCGALLVAPQSTVGDAQALTMLVRTPAYAGLVGDVAGGLTSTLTKTVKSVTGTTGGTVRAGRFAVEIPAEAFDGTGDVTVDVPDTTMLKVNLEIANVPNRFDVPVTLVVSYAGMEDDPSLDPAYFKIFWYDEKSAVWRMMPTTVDTKLRTVSTELEHFSTYGVLEAKAGW